MFSEIQNTEQVKLNSGAPDARLRRCPAAAVRRLAPWRTAEFVTISLHAFARRPYGAVSVKTKSWAESVQKSRFVQFGAKNRQDAAPLSPHLGASNYELKLGR
jgi:hypothetical protein